MDLPIGPTIFSILLLILACNAAILSIGLSAGESTFKSFGAGSGTLAAAELNPELPVMELKFITSLMSSELDYI